jgi:hypothetical protein
MVCLLVRETVAQNDVPIPIIARTFFLIGTQQQPVAPHQASALMEDASGSKVDMTIGMMKPSFFSFMT